MDNFLTNTFSIVIQPKQNFHFRYESELRNTHGVVTGQLQESLGQQSPSSSVTEETYPTIRLQLPSDSHLDECGNKRDFFVLCSLHSYDNGGAHSLSPHLLMAKGNRTVSYDFIFAPMQENSDHPLERSWQLKDYVIVRLKPEDYRKSLDGKRRHAERLQLAQAFENLKGDLDLQQQSSVKASGILNVCLGFTIYERNFYTNEYRLYKETIYSNNIFHGDDLRIHQLCNTKGPIVGGTKIHILIKVPSGYRYFVRMFKFSSDMTAVDWEVFVPVTNQDIFSNAAITYTLPPGPPNVRDDEIEVMIEVVVNQSTYRSKGVKFWYLNSDTDNDSSRRKRPRRNEVATDQSFTTAPLAIEQAHVLNYNYAINPNLMHYNNSNAISQEALPVEPPFAEDQSLDAILGTDLDTLNLTEEYAEILDSLLSLDLPLPSVNTNTSPYYSEDRCESIERQRKQASKKASVEMINKLKIKQIKMRIDNILKMKSAEEVDTKGLGNKNGNTIFHDALMLTAKEDMDPLIYIYRKQKKSIKLKELLVTARNAYRQNLLHYACVLNKPFCIKPLVGIGVALHEQDSLGRTPLHIAIDHQYKECLEKIQKLLEDPSEYPNVVEKQLIKMFQVYSHKGHTVLHAAVIADLYELVEVMLKFCKSRNLDIFEHEALGNGDSVAHLIAQRNLVRMIPLIRHYGPHYLSIKNYPGKTVLDVPELSQEMLNALVAPSDDRELAKLMFRSLNINESQKD